MSLLNFVANQDGRRVLGVAPRQYQLSSELNKLTQKFQRPLIGRQSARAVGSIVPIADVSKWQKYLLSISSLSITILSELTQYSNHAY